MAEIIDSSFQTNTIGQRFSFKADIDFVQQSIRNGNSAIIESIIGKYYNPALSYIISGCIINTDGLGNTLVSAGYIYGITKQYGGMPLQSYVYYHPGSKFITPSGANVIVCNTIKTFSTLDPTPFTNGSNNNVHNIITVLFSAGASGSGDVDYNSLVNVSKIKLPFTSNGITLINTGSQYFTTSQGAPYFDVSYEIDDNIVTLCGCINVNSSNAGNVGRLPLLTLPDIAIPSKRVILNPETSLQNLNGSFYIDIYGDFSYSVSVQSSGAVFLDGISYRRN